ncbi:ABC transporter ATP-binding protein [Sesbania bispinosa]|nr:ABC transporter ATP-binding protein [Sesbania bispinosa]
MLKQGESKKAVEKKQKKILPDKLRRYSVTVRPQEDTLIVQSKVTETPSQI